MDLIQDNTLFGEEPQADSAQLFEKDTNVSLPPRNPDEMAAQLALANDKDVERPFNERMKDRAQSIATNGADPLLQDVATQEREDVQAGARKVAEDKAAQGDVIGLQSAAQLIKRERDRLAPTRVEGMQATAHRSLEAMGFRYAADRYKNLQGFDEAVQQGAEQLTLRNLVAGAASELEGQTSLWDKISHFAGSVFLNPIYEVIGQKAINRVTGGSGVNPLSSYTSVDEMRTFFLGLRPEERIEVVKGLMKEELGFFGSNKAANVELLHKLGEMTLADSSVDAVFNAMNVADAAQIGKLMFSAVRRGAPAKVLNEVAGGEAAAGVVVRDLTAGSKVGGLNEPDLIARMLAIGKNPMDVDPAAFAGMSSAGQTQLRSAWNDLLEQTRDRLVSSGLTADEIKQGLMDIRAKYSPETNQAIHSAIFGEGSESGQKMTVFWQGQDGRAFGSKEAAEAWAKAEGKADYEVVPKNTATTFNARIIEDDELDRLTRSPMKGNVLDAPNERVNDLLTRMQYAGDGEPVTQHLIDNWRQAANKSRTGVNGESILQIIASQSADEDFRFLAQHLLDAGEKKGVNWRGVKVELHYDLSDRGGSYNVATNDVRVGLSAAVDQETLLHELLHAHNAQVVTLVSGSPKLAAMALTREQIAAAKDLIELHKRMKNWFENAVMKEKEKYGGMIEDLGTIANESKLRFAMEHPAELITYGLTNTRVRNQLQKIKLRELGYSGNDATVWSKLWEMFKGMLGFRADDTVLARLVATHENLANTIEGGAQRSITNMVNVGAMSVPDVNALMRAGAKGQFAARKAGPMGMGKALDKEIAKTEKLAASGDEAALERLKVLREARAALAPKKAAPAAPTEEWLVKEQRVDPISFDNVGKFSDEDMRSMPWLAIDPKHQASEMAVEERVIGVHAEAKTRRDLTSFLTPYFDKLSKAGKVRVKAVLEQGDAVSNAGGQTGKEFSYAELRARGLDENEAMAYFAARQVRMVSYHLRNAEMVRSLRAEGLKEVEFLGTGEKYAGKVLEQEQAGQALGRVIYDSTTGKQYLVDSKTIEDSYRGGKRIVQLKAPANLDGKLYFHVLVDDTSAKARDIQTGLHYRPGEFSRVYTDQYFITMKKVAEVDGKMQDLTETVRTAASAREAQEYVEAHRQAFELLLNSRTKGVPGNLDRELDKLVGRYTDPKELRARFEKGEFDGYTGLDSHYTRNREEFLNGSISEAMSNGRLFTSRRSDKLLSVDRDRINTLDVYESLEAEITNISRVANISMWRDNMVRRWMNTFGHMVPNRTGNDVADFFSAAGAKFTSGTPEAQFAERTHRYIVRQLGIKTQEEKYWEGMTRVLTEKLFTGNEKIESLGASIRTMSWLGFIRNVNFNLNLGMFNPAQLLVQANGAVTAAILSPLHGAKAAMTFPLLRMALMSDNPDVWRKLARVEKLKNLGMSSETEFFQLVKSIRKAGIIDNVRSTALWNLEDGALNVFGGYPTRAWQSNTFFFNRGEEFSRIVSFDVARREWIAKNPGKEWSGDAALKQIVVRMDDLTQNMTKANLARFQEGVLSIPLQFAQYNIKLAANITSAYLTKGQGRGFTKTEATQLLLGHILLYGAAGNGLTWVMDEVLPTSVKDKMPVAAKEMMTQGLISWAVDETAKALTGEGAKVALGSRLGSFDYYQRIGEALFKDPGNFYEALLGPTVSSAKRIGVFGEVARLWWKDPELTGQDVLEGLSKMATEQVATLRNASKAYLYMQHQGLMLDRQGVAIGKLNRNELLAQAVGFQPTVAQDVNNLIKSKKDHNDAIDDIAKLVLRTQRDILTDLKEGNMQRAEERKKLLQALWPQNAGDFMEVQRRVRDRLYPLETEFQKLLGDYILKGQTYNKPVVVTEEPKKGMP